MRLFISLVLALQTAVTSGSPGSTEMREANDLPSADDVIQLALDKADQRERRNLEASYGFISLSKSEKLDKDGNPRIIETRLFQNVPYRGHSYERLIEIDGRLLAPEEKRKEEKREREFRKKVDKGDPPLGSNEERMSSTRNW
jgi:hypothetical protein